jgi:alpha 1,3-glucosidase
VDDGDSFDYEHGQYIHRTFTLKDGVFSSTDAEGRDTKAIKAGDWLRRMENVKVEKIVIVGAPSSWDTAQALVQSEGESWTASMSYHKAEHGRAAFVTIGYVGARIGHDFTVKPNA